MKYKCHANKNINGKCFQRDTWQWESDLLILKQVLFSVLPFQISPQDGNAGLRAVRKAIITEIGSAYSGELLYSKLLLNLHSLAGSLSKALHKDVVTDQLLVKGWNLGTRSLWINTLEQWELNCSCSTNSRKAFNTHQLWGTINFFC